MLGLDAGMQMPLRERRKHCQVLRARFQQLADRSGSRG